MAVYETSNYSVVSIMKKIKTVGDTSTMVAGGIYIQGKPIDDYPDIIASWIDLDENSLSEVDFDDLTKFTTNVIPIYEASYYETSLNKHLEYTTSYANSAISVESLYVSSATR
jgi:hypothetical protein